MGEKKLPLQGNVVSPHHIFLELRKKTKFVKRIGKTSQIEEKREINKIEIFVFSGWGPPVGADRSVSSRQYGRTSWLILGIKEK